MKVSVVSDGLTYWQCSTCHEWKLPEDFHSDKCASNGLDSRCKPCRIKSVIDSRKRKAQEAAARIEELEEACRVALAHFEAEWEAVDNHPSSGYWRDVEYFKKVLAE